MADFIDAKGTKIYLNFETQISKLGRPFRLSGTRKVDNEKWINRELKSHWVHSFIYLDEQGGFFEIELNFHKEFVKLTKL
jgi:hypothetical protein